MAALCCTAVILFLVEYCWHISALRSCSEVKACNSQYADGEYWIYPAPYGTTKVKIYCHGMGSGSPTEYVTLVEKNKGFYPAYSSNDCMTQRALGYDEDSVCSGEGGVTTYHKIRVKIQTMEVDRMDNSFVEQELAVTVPYGEAADCYTRHYFGNRNVYGPEGYFHIDTTGTGLIVDQTLTFPVFGDFAWGQTIRNKQGTEIDLLCGGFPGGCRPVTPMMLKVGPTEPSSESARNPTC
ncbi:A disintegrin and metalloproteinase with thrombospondin motifs 9-like [Gigantopelta aegis]|uniref:A disintegrin and metalloproteinase with thrombospondin motifs 9-like n=1 Tax=Gigantopelta aegis TaxID=1735272 RepID=UPI001B8892B9|nr:A disintegrin and metalloproteinase with thrombospondin motifs 9-like [Gigantopelta aegis]